MSRPSPAFVRKLHPGDTEILDAFLSADPVQYIYPLGWLRREGISASPSLSFEFHGAFRHGELLGASLLAGRVLLFLACKDGQIGRALCTYAAAHFLAFRVLVGPDDAVTEAWNGLSEMGLKARLQRPQRILAVDAVQLKRHLCPELRLAEPDDVEVLTHASLEMHAHETLETPLAEEIPIFRRTVEYQIENRRLFVWTDGFPPSLRFKASISAMCELGAQVEGVFVPGAHRGKGFALRGLS
ncbi:MAG: DUF4081 domain-containing protein, partial [Myxococcales bacterium]|nr:DUF4081 domain-containing protein [Myxococcales bacterium]